MQRRKGGVLIALHMGVGGAPLCNRSKRRSNSMADYFQQTVPIGGYFVSVGYDDSRDEIIDNIIIIPPNGYTGFISRVVLRFYAGPQRRIIYMDIDNKGYVSITTKRDFGTVYKVLQTEKPLYFDCNGDGDLSKLTPGGGDGNELEILIWEVRSSFKPIGEGPVDLSP